MTFKTVTEARQKALMVNDWSVSMTMKESKEMLPQEGEDGTGQDYVIKIQGGEEFTGKQFEDMLDRWVDKSNTIESIKTNQVKKNEDDIVMEPEDTSQEDDDESS